MKTDDPDFNAAPVLLQTLGRFSLEWAGAEVSPLLRQPKRFAVLAYLAVTTAEGLCRRDELLSVFWPESPQRRARAALRNALYGLRQALPQGAIATHGDEMVRIDPAVVSTDAVQFARAIDRGDLATAMHLYQGDFLAGFHLKQGIEFESWRESKAATFHRSAIHAALRLADECATLEDFEDAERWLRRAIAFAPHDEELVRRLITLHLERGNRGAASQVFGELRERLRVLEVEPSLSTGQLLERADVQPTRQRIEPVPNTSQVGHLPSRVDPRVERPDEGERTKASRARRMTTWARNTLPVSAAALLAVVFGALGVSDWLETRWARTEGFQDFRMRVAERDLVGALSLSERLDPVLSGDEEYESLLTQATFPSTVRSTPDSAEIYIKDYSSPDGPWLFLGTTPLEDVRVPATYLRWRIEPPGLPPVERAALDSYFSNSIHFDVVARGGTPDMLRVSGAALNLGAPYSMKLQPYWLDRDEVTNAMYAEFVGAGVYPALVSHWSTPGTGPISTASLESAPAFVDRTGLPGPSTWVGGRYPDGEGGHPVSGVSWYEADAYCRWAGKELPTAFHWYGAGGFHGHSSIVELSNFSNQKTASAGASQAIGPYGHADLAGNVREWVANSHGELRYILGGAYDSPPYLFWVPDAAAPDDRATRNGFRCAVLNEPSDHPSRADVRRKDPAGPQPTLDDSALAHLADHFAYDGAPLAASVDSVANGSPQWRREFVSFDAGYDGERVQAQLFLPRHHAPPYEVVVFHPGADATRLESAAQAHTWWFDFLVASGRAVIYPTYKGTYERRTPISGPVDYRAQIVQRVTDLRRSIDYLETRDDIDVSTLAYYGFSEGALLAPAAATLEDRITRSVVLSGGLFDRPFDPVIEPRNYLAQARTPLLMVGGEFDFIFPVRRSQRPFFEAWNAPEDHKRFVELPFGHAPRHMNEVAAVVLPWLDGDRR